jgi:chemosensory pili system protein ChpC
VSETFQVVPSILIPMGEQPLVVPCAVVAEVVRYSPPRPVPESPPWLLGHVRWRDRSVAVASFDAARGAREGQSGTPANLVVLNVLRPDPEVAFYALATWGTPRLVQVSDRTVAEREGSAPGPLVSREVLIKGDPARIPDLPALEDLILSQGSVYSDASAVTPEQPG